MLYRKLGRTDWDVSALGFGAMRLPMVGDPGPLARFDASKPIDEEQCLRMVEYALDHGVNYFDTAFPYHGGKSEVILGRALKHRRAEVLIATKLPTWEIKKPEDCDRILDTQLKRLDVDCIDVYLVHGLSRPLWRLAQKFNMLDFMEKARSDGRIREIGFSFHDDFKIFKEIVDGFDWAMCQIQFNYFDEHYQAGHAGLQYAAGKGIGVVIMEPLRGGKLTEKIPPAVREIWGASPIKRTPAEWALRWVWNHPEVSTVLSGMSSFSQVEENVRTADDAVPESLSTEELDTVRKVADTYREMLKIPCTGCGYCVPCPNGVNIPLNFNLYNDTFMFKDPEVTQGLYHFMMGPEARASNCRECGECEERCPQQIEIMEALKKVHAHLGG